MADLRTLGATSNRVRFTLKDKTTGQGKTGLSISTTGLIISTIADNEASATAYTQGGSTIETIATLGTFATPTSSKCRFKAVDATNHPGLYEFQFANARFAVASAKRLVISVNDAESTILDGDYEVEFTNDLVASVWDEINSGATHNLANSTGKQLRSVSGNTDVIYSSTLPSQAGVATNQVKLDTGASSSDSAYVGDRMSAVGASTGQGSLICIAYVGSTRLATLNSTWAVVPIAGDTVEVTPAATAQVVSYITGQDPATLVWAAGSRTITGGTITTLSNLPAITTDWITAAGVSADAVTKIQAGLSTFGGGTVDANIVQILGQTALATQQGLLDVRLAEVDGTSTAVAHAGTLGSSVATLALAKLEVKASSGRAVHFECSSSSGRGLSIANYDTFNGVAFEIFGGNRGLWLGSDVGVGAEIYGGASGPALALLGPYTTPGPAVVISTDSGNDNHSAGGHGVSILAAGTGSKALLLSGDAATDSLAIAAGAGSPIDVFDAAARVTGSATLLDATPITDPGGVASTFPQMLVAIWRWFYKRKTKAVSGLTIKTYADDNTTVNTTQPYTDNGLGDQTQGSAT